MFQTNECRHNHLELLVRKKDKDDKIHYIDPPRQKLAICWYCNKFFINGKIDFEFPKTFLKNAFTFGKKRCSNKNCKKKAIVNLWYLHPRTNVYTTIKVYILCERCDTVYFFEDSTNEYHSIYRNSSILPLKVGRRVIA